MKSLSTILLSSVAGLAMVAGAQAADLPTKKTPPAPPATSCYASFYSWLDSTATDCPLSAMGITVYGTIDVGAGYSTNAAPFNKDYPNGVQEIVSKQSNSGGKWQWVPNALSQSNVGIKIKEQIVPNTYVIGDVNLGFDPYSFQLSNGPGSLTENNGIAQIHQTANADSSRAGQWDNSRAYVGLSNTTFGTLTFGRQYAFTNDMSANYDAMGGAYAFSLLSSGSYVAGMGDTETARYNTSFKYQVAVGAFRAGALAQVGNYSQGNGAENAYQFDVGGDYAGFSVDAIYSYAQDAVFLGTLSGALPGNDDLSAKIANISSGAVAAKYTNGPWKVFAGYMYASYSNATNSYAVDAYNDGFTGVGGYDVPVHLGQTLLNNAVTAYNGKILQGAWVGAKYAVRSDLDVAASYYYEGQNTYAGSSKPNCAAAAAPGQGTVSSNCSGTTQAVSGLIDWRPVKRLDVYAGVMYSEVTGGMASGFLHSNNVDPTVGLRLNF